MPIRIYIIPTDETYNISTYTYIFHPRDCKKDVYFILLYMVFGEAIVLDLMNYLLYFMLRVKI